MASNGLTRNNNFIFNIYEYLLCAYIIFTPIINSSKIYLFGFGIHITIISLLIMFAFFITMFKKEKNNMFFSQLILIVFLFKFFQGFVEKKEMVVGIIFALLSYIIFLQIPNNVSKIKIFFSYYVSTVIAMVYTLISGLTNGSLSRTATSVDGSISIIGMAIVLFGEDLHIKSFWYKSLKFISFISCIVIAAFGMSRARLAIMAVIILIKLIQMVIVLIKTDRMGVYSIIWLNLILAAIIFVPRLDVFQGLIAEISLRFEDGFQSLGRTEEISVGWEMFLKNMFSGIGFADFKFLDYQNYYSSYYNHCMYVAILARGGLLLGIPFLLSFCSLLIKVIKVKNLFCYVVLFSFLALGYGNAGLFNFTICGFMIPLVIVLNRKRDTAEVPVHI